MNWDTWKQKKYEEIAFFAKLAIRFMAKQGRLPEAAILDALAAAKADSWEAGGKAEGMALSAEAQESLAAELLRECMGLFSEDECSYLQMRIDSTLQRKPQQQKGETAKWALYYYYLMKAETIPNLRGEKKKLEELGKQHGLGPVSFYQTFGAIEKKRNDKNPLKLNILEVVIPMLAQYPEALAMAQKDFQELQKRTKE